MPVHPLVSQLQFSRRELMRCLEGVSEEDATRRLMPMNCISWTVAHLANQEAFYWVLIAQGDMSFRYLNEIAGYGKPATTPSLAEMRQSWEAVTRRADEFLTTLTPGMASACLEFRGKPLDENTGTLLLRVIHHYWFHIGNIYAMREMLGHTDLPEFVGDFTGYEWK